MITKILHSNKPIAEPPKSAYLLSSGEHSQRCYSLINERVLIGRSHDCQIETSDPCTSSKHASIERRREGFFIKDLQSRNGTFINGNKVIEAELKDQDRLQIGNSQFTFSHRSEESHQTLFKKSKNQKWNQQLKNLPNMAQSDFSVLITGPSGSGKEILARQIHELSERKTGPFVSVNCSALGESLIESELFGHIKGSFTGASENRKGAFEAARGGTLFLDEIGDLPIGLQPKLLRALENSEIKPVGSDICKITDVRILSATHNTVENKIIEKTFREDLYYRLNILQIKPPPLKDRIEDFDDLIYYFSRKYRVSFSFASLQELKKYSWPGNIRELKNFVARASTIFKRQQVNIEDLDNLLQKHPQTQEKVLLPNNINTLDDLRNAEKLLIRNSLLKSGGNQRKAAEKLGMAKSTLHDKIKTYDIKVKELFD